MKLELVLPEPFGFLVDDGFESGARRGIVTKLFLVEENHAAFAERADGEFALPGMADFADDENVERPVKNLRHFRGHDHSAARKAEHEVHVNAFVLQVASEPAPRVLP